MHSQIYELSTGPQKNIRTQKSILQNSTYQLISCILAVRDILSTPAFHHLKSEILNHL